MEPTNNTTADNAVINPTLATVGKIHYLVDISFIIFSFIF
jgi:hypothetical protein